MSEIRIAVIGCGGFHKKHVTTYRNRQDCRIVALCDVSQEQIEGFIRRNEMSQEEVADIARFTGNLDEMYETLKPDAVSIATPHTLHYEQAAQAIDAGCHVMVEKPMVTSAEHAHDLTRRVREKGKVFVIAYNTPCTPEFRYLRNLIRTGELGRLEMVVGHLSQDWLPRTRGLWRQDPALSGGGQAYDSGAHLLNSICWTVESRIRTLHAVIDRFDTAVDINSIINVCFHNNVMAAIGINGNCPLWSSHAAYMFTEGKVEIDGWTGKWINIYRGTELVKYPPITDPPTTPADNFLDAIQGKTDALTCPENGIWQSELMDAIYQSADTGQPVHYH